MHSVFVLSHNGQPLTPTTPARARRLLNARAATTVWSKFGTFGIQLLAPTAQHTPLTTLGMDSGSKFDGYAVVCGQENVLSVKLDLPDKKGIVNKISERRALRQARRFRTTWRRPARFNNRRKHDWLAPSQAVIVNSRLKVLRELCRLYPITQVGFEDVRFNHAAKRWGANFSTVEIGKARIRTFFVERGITVTDFAGYETQALREGLGYRKTRNKAADCFESHCSDALTLACAVAGAKRVEPGVFLVVDDTYRCVRRKLHDTQPAKGGIREAYSHGTVFGLRKGLKIGTIRGKVGQLCGLYNGGYRFYAARGQRQSSTRLAWISTSFIIRKG